MCKCYKIEQAINHHDIKVSRQEAQKEIEFGLETYLGLKHDREEEMVWPYEYDPEEMEHWVIDAFRTGEMPVFAARFWGIID